MTADPAFDFNAPRNWDDQSASRAADLVRRRVEGRIRYFYCTRGRTCDGKPHEGYDYPHARADQWPPPGQDWFVWAILSGRGAGKTRTGSEWVRKMSERVPAIALIGRRGVDVRDTMVEGVGETPENGAGLIWACERAGVGYLWEPSKKQFTFANGCVAIGISAEEPDSLRGKNFSAAWLDEPAHMPLIDEVWSMLKLTMRQKQTGGRSKVLITTTPKPTKWMKEIVKRDNTKVVRVSTHANRDNLDPTFVEEILGDFNGTRLGRQEIDGEILEDVEGALWSSALIQRTSVDTEITPYARVIVAVDPAGTANKRSDETGIVVVGTIGDHFYVIADYSGTYTPAQWARKVQYAYEHHQADRVIVERNYGQDMVETTLRNVDVNLPISTVNSRRGKVLRAEPIVALYEQQKVWHVESMAEPGHLSGLETQMTEWVPDEDDSPDRVDALVHGLAHLSGRGGPMEMAVPAGRGGSSGPVGSARVQRALSALRSRT